MEHQVLTKSSTFDNLEALVQGWHGISWHGFLEGQGDLVSGLIWGVNGVTIWIIEVINLLTKSP